MIATLTFDAGLTLWTIATFGILLALLARFVFRPLRRALDAREARIRQALDDAARAGDDARRLIAANAERMAEARREARRLVDEGHKLVAQMRRETEQTARQEAERLIAEGRREIEAEVRRNLEGLKVTIANLSLRISRQVIKEGLDEQRHRDLAEQFVERLKTHGPQTP